MSSQSHINNRLESISEYLSHPLVSSLFLIHPNNLGDSSFTPPQEWQSWWNWAGREVEGDSSPTKEDPWLLLLRHYDACRTASQDIVSFGQCDSIPLSLRILIRDACALALPREVGKTFPPRGGLSIDRRLHEVGSSTLPGMSPKKTHEVLKMSDFVQTLLTEDPSLSNVRHAVDIGAGQAYLSRILRDRQGLHVLALDWSEVQSQGAARKDTSRANRRSREHQTQRAADIHPASTTAASQSDEVDDDRRQSRDRSLSYVTTKIDPESLLSFTEAWLKDGNSKPPVLPNSPSPASIGGVGPIPVLFVALHACGSLTPDILRAFLIARKEPSEGTVWAPQAAVIVGCCYNMLRPEEFPLSRSMRSLYPKLLLTSNHLQLAAQVPSQWTRSEKTLGEARFALRKVVWRALVEDVIHQHEAGNATEDLGAADPQRERRTRKLGRLNDSAYADWHTFIDVIRTKLTFENGKLPKRDAALEKRVEVFHTLRCIVGPVMECCILLDRLGWVIEELQGEPFDVELVNLFDQASGSGRNIAFVIRPSQSGCTDQEAVSR